MQVRIINTTQIRLAIESGYRRTGRCSLCVNIAANIRARSKDTDNIIRTNTRLNVVAS